MIRLHWESETAQEQHLAGMDHRCPWPEIHQQRGWVVPKSLRND